MKTLRLFTLLLGVGLCFGSANAQRHGGKYTPTVYTVAVEEIDVIGDCPMQAAMAKCSMAAAAARDGYLMTQRNGFQQVHLHIRGFQFGKVGENIHRTGQRTHNDGYICLCRNLENATAEVVQFLIRLNISLRKYST